MASRFQANAEGSHNVAFIAEFSPHAGRLVRLLAGHGTGGTTRPAWPPLGYFLLLSLEGVAVRLGPAAGSAAWRGCGNEAKHACVRDNG